MKKSKILSWVMFALLAIPSSLLLSGCGEPTTYAADKKEVYAFSALSSAQYLSKQTEQIQQRSKLLFANEVATARPELIKNDIETINEYVGMFEGYLFNGGMKPTETTPSVAVDGEIYGKYNIKLSMNIPNANDSKTEYIMYYNELNSETDVEIDDEDEEEVETETSLEGVLLFDSQVFIVSGEKSVEIEGNEHEVEIKFTTKSKTNPNNYIVVKQEMEQEEIEFEYSIYENGSLKSKNKIEWESEDNEQELSIQFISLVDGSYSKVKYNLEKEISEGKNIIKVKYKNGENQESFTITDNGTKNLYNYGNGFSEELDKV